MERKISGSREARKRRFCRLDLRSLGIWQFLQRDRATLQRIFRFKGDISFLALEVSSSKITSRHQCSWFSIDQWHRTAWAKCSSSVSEEMKYRVSVEVFPFLVIVVRTSPTNFRPLQFFCSGSQDRSVNKRYSRFFYPAMVFFICVEQRNFFPKAVKIQNYILQ